MTAAIAAGLAVLVLGAWLGAAGTARLRAPLDRLHGVAFVNATCGPLLVAVAFLADGASDRALKIAFMVLAALVLGAAQSHAAGRALPTRGSGAERP